MVWPLSDFQWNPLLSLSVCLSVLLLQLFGSIDILLICSLFIQQVHRAGKEGSLESLWCMHQQTTTRIQPTAKMDHQNHPLITREDAYTILITIKLSYMQLVPRVLACLLEKMQ